MEALDWLFLAVGAGCLGTALALLVHRRTSIPDGGRARVTTPTAWVMLGTAAQFALLVLDRLLDGGPGGLLTALHLAAVAVTFVLLWRTHRLRHGPAGRPA
jgi:hypothetical protein